ncbi:MAG: hypothetical protein OXF61_16540 [Acidimicrobiaceae bacterium]|nr:hypothetical protein [Acidimicrobiaceae bacterium]
MSTITEMTGEDAPATETAPPVPTPAAVAGGAAKPVRLRSIPLPTAITAALIAAMFGLLYLNLNGLRADIDGMRGEIGSLRSDMSGEIGSLRSDMSAEIGSLRSDMSAEIGSLRSEMRAQINEINMVLLDHTDRLARIETHLEIIRQPDSQAAGSPQ